MTESGTPITGDREKTVMVAMSGGVDSATAAAVLVERGYRVVGVTMLLWPEEAPGTEDGCCGTVHLADARAVCHRLGIRHYTMDLRREFLTEVVGPFVETYLSGRTPNPCILCNEHLKFRHLLKKARAVGADLLATGHYARILGHGPYRLARGRDDTKDQSYFLFATEQEILSQLVLPLGEMTKTEVRRMAGRLGLSVHEKPESQEICFVPRGGLRDFIRQNASRLPGPGRVVDTHGKVIGRHEGACFYTVGQRRGFGIAAREPLYVVHIDADDNTVVLGSREESSAAGLMAGKIIWIAGAPPAERFRATAQIRHQHRPVDADVELAGDRIQIRFGEPQHGVAPGQAVVLYDGPVVLGGGWIESAIC